MAGKTGARQRRFRIETMRGEPKWVGGRKLTPVARVVSFGRARATIGHARGTIGHARATIGHARATIGHARGTIGSGRVSGWGGGFFRVTPLALIEDAPEGKRRVAVSNATTTALAGLLGAATAVTVFCTVLRWLLRRSRRRGSPLFPRRV
jgi:hypothetical protein